MHAAWYMTSHGLFNGASLYEEANVKLKANDVVKLHLSWTPNHRGTLRFTLNGQHVVSWVTARVENVCECLIELDLDTTGRRNWRHPRSCSFGLPAAQQRRFDCLSERRTRWCPIRKRRAEKKGRGTGWLDAIKSASRRVFGALVARCRL